MSEKQFVHLHLHTGYSLLDGMIHLDELVNAAFANEMEALAITDHGNIFGAVQFCQKAKNKGIKPIIGCELYLAPRSRFDDDVVGIDGRRPYSHLIVLCENEKGYKNLCKLLTSAYQEGFKYKPRVDKEILSSHSEGLIASSACLGGEIPRKIRQGRFEEALKSAEEFKEIFGKDNFFLEIQEHGLPSQEEVNDAIIQISEKTNIPLVVTNDVHFLRKEDFEAHKILLCIQTKTTLEEREGKGKEAYTREHYFKTKEEIWGRFKNFEEGLLNTVEIAKRCRFEFDFETRHFPKFEVPQGYSTIDYFDEIVKKGFEKKILNSPKIKEEDKKHYKERLDFESELIVRMDFVSYFLIVSDFIKFAKENKIPVGPGRGSAAGSLVSYCLDITDIDPIKYNLLFERFLNPERVSMPDIDIDFCVRGREKVIDYVKQKYGNDNVSQIITFGELKAKSAIRDVGRVLGMELKKVDKVAKLIPVEQGSVIGVEHAIKTTLKEIYEKDDEVKKILDYVKKIEYLPRHAGMHAAGVVIAPEPIYNFCPLFRGSKGEDVTQFEKDDIQSIGLLKMDFLGLRTITIIHDTFELIKKSGGKAPTLEEIPLEDKKTFELFSAGNTDAVFQFESPGMKDALRRLKPTKIEQLIVLNALYRPGPLGAGILNDYIERAHHPEKVTYLLEELKPILEETLGLIVYQEQVMQIANKIAGFSLGEADLLRQAISKKNAEKMKVLEEKFRNGASDRKYDRKIVDSLIDQIKYFGGYGFNKSHSAAYTLVAYWTGYLKAHFPEAFMAATLSNFMDKIDDIIKLMNSCRENGIELLPPDVNLSEESFTLEKNAIRYGLSAIKNVGTASVKAILNARARVGKFTDLYQFCSEVDHESINKRVVENLIQAGAMDSFGAPRWDLFEAVDTALQAGAKTQSDKKRGQYGLFEDEEEMEEQVSYPKAKKWEKLEIYHREKQSLGFYLTGHPLTEKKSLLHLLTTHKISELKNLEDSEPVALGGVIIKSSPKKSKEKKEPYGQFILEDMEATVEVMIFKDAYTKHLKNIEKNSAVLVIGRTRSEGDNVRIFADAVVPLEKAESELQDNIVAVQIALPVTLLDNDFITTLKNVIENFRGRTPLRFLIKEDESTNVLVSASHSYSVRVCEEFKKSVEEIVGKERLKYFFRISNNRQNGG